MKSGKEIQREISNLGIENGFIQELGEHEEEYVLNGITKINGIINFIKRS